MRRMSFSLTTTQVLAQTKTVTRRLGWKNLKPGTELLAVEKAMGLKQGEKSRVLATIRVLSVRTERLDAITDVEVYREGFPDHSAAAFVAMFCEHMGVREDALVNRIEFEYVEAP